MAAPALIKILPKLLPAAKLAYDHRDKALEFYKKIQQWRNKEASQTTKTIKTHESLSVDEQFHDLRAMIFQRDEIITEQSDIMAKLASDLSELSNLTDKLRRRSQFLFRALYLTIFIVIIRAIFF